MISLKIACVEAVIRHKFDYKGLKKYPYSLHRGHCNFLRVGSSLKLTFKEIIGISRGLGVWRYCYFLELHISKRSPSLLSHSTKELKVF